MKFCAVTRGGVVGTVDGINPAMPIAIIWNIPQFP